MALPRGLDETVAGGRDDGYAVAAARSARSARRRQRSRLLPLVAVVLALALVGVAAYGAYLFVPTATITLRPMVTTVGPVNGTVIADPRVTVVDPGAGVVPAQLLRLPLSVNGEFEATGQQVTNTRASGEVRFRSTNTVNEIDVPAGTRVSTEGGVDFETTAAVTVPRADFDSQTPGTADAPIRARRAGEAGNVAARSITVLPAALAEQQLSVSNPEPTSGGARLEVKVVAREDYDAAVDTLTADLSTRLAEALAEPNLAPTGMTVFAESATLGAAEASDPPGAVVDTVADSFSLALAAEATVLAVNESLVDHVALEQLRALVPAGSTLLEGSLEVSHAPGEIEGGVISFNASADGAAYRMPDRTALVEQIRGKTVAEARAIMETYGSVDMSIWPEFIDRVPDQPSRINLTIEPPTETT
jgi:hypothetical protein